MLLRKKIYIVFSVFIFMLLAFFLLNTNSNFLSLFEKSTTASVSTEVLVADMGGVGVEIPHYFAKYVEFNGDPGWGEKRRDTPTGNASLRKLRSFGFDVRYPDMAGLSSPEMHQIKSNTSIYKTKWIRVGVNTGEIYTDDDFLDRIVNGTLSVSDTTPKYEVYKVLKEKEHNLTVYVPFGVDQETKKPYRQYQFAKDIYVYREPNGKVFTFISCSNSVLKSASCRQMFMLQGPAKAQVYFSYRRGLLSEWRQMQESINNLILSFEAK